MKKIIYILMVLWVANVQSQNVLRISGNTDRQQVDSLYLTGTVLNMKIQNSLQDLLDGTIEIRQY